MNEILGTNRVRSSLTGKDIILNNIDENPKNVTNFIFLIAEHFVYKRRCAQKDLSIRAFEYEINYIENIEKYNTIKYGAMDKHFKKWSNVHTRLDRVIEDSYVSNYIDYMEI